MSVDRMREFVAEHEGEFVFGLELLEQAYGQDQGAVRRAFASIGRGGEDAHFRLERLAANSRRQSSFIITPCT